jgi:hypothetical protein
MAYLQKTQCLAFVVLMSAAGATALAQAPQKGGAPMPPAAAAPPPAAPPAAGQPPAGPPKPAKELEDFMKGFEGNWKCDTKMAPGSMGPGSPEMNVKTTVKFKKDLDGFFWRGDYEMKKQKGMPMNMKGILYVGYDPGSAQVTVSFMDSTGGVGFGTGKIEGDKVTYVSDGYMMGAKVKTRETMSKPGPKEAMHTMEVDMGKGFQPMGTDTCKR